MDEMVLTVQNWLNATYTGKPGYNPVNPSGKTGWETMYGLTRALQIELGIATPADSVGPTTLQYLTNLGPISMNSNTKTNIVLIIQGGMYCKGYNPGGFTGVFGSGTQSGIASMQSNLGIQNPDGVVTPKLFKALLNMDAYVLLEGGNPKIRSIQQWLNNKYIKRQNFFYMPCDGFYSRDVQKSLVYGIQYEEGLDDATANGNFGPTTQRLIPTLNVNDVDGNHSFIHLFQAAMIFNNFDVSFDGIFNTTLSNTVKGFQKFCMLPQTGIGDFQTWASLLQSTGDPTRKGTACDCITEVTPARAQTLKNAGYTTVGRYLTNASATGLNKKIQPGELENIFAAGLSVFPIYQTYGGDATYFNRRQGASDATAAYIAAEKYGFKEGTTIYFSVDFDVLGDEITNNILPHFSAIKSEFASMGGKFKVGIYGPRAVGIRAHEAGYAEYTFVSGMSTGFSGNLGYPLPPNWSFDQISTITVGTGVGSIQIDNNINSGRDSGQFSVSPSPSLDGLDYPLAFPYINSVRNEVSPVVDSGKNWFQKWILEDFGDVIGADFYLISAKDAVENVLNHDALITRLARKLQMRKSFIQTVLAWESSVENILDVAKDLLVDEGVESDSSTGPCQIFAATAIKARGWAAYNGYLEEEILDPSNPVHLRVIWEALNSNPTYNIESAAWVLKWGAVHILGLNVNMLDYNEEEIKATLARYNGTGDKATEYGERNYSIYQAFEQYNELSRLGN
ncbi:glycoside hydrolase domain-containing protein [Neobacillus jeddahensis]|uniref:glycoside hydrolase domain-containing protein n=1 Tax=Neobacillus jeddahensis TaxID=1461580 RepID=UPI00058CD449|nr:glycoside hydrolase domain-containing protein [Neobacillus jeddahensis]